MYNDYIYSIVAGYYLNGGLQYYRLADIDLNSKKVVEAVYNTNDDYYLYEPVSFVTKGLKKEYETKLVKWCYDLEDERKQYVYDSDVKFKVYEVVYLYDDGRNVLYDESKTRERLEDGFLISKQINKEFLLIVGWKDKSQVALLCNKKDFKKKVIDNSNYECLYIDKNMNDLNQVTVSFDLYELDKNSIVSIDNLLDHPYSRNIDVVERYFYEDLELPSRKEKFLTRMAKDYFISYISKCFKDNKQIYELTNKERAKFISILEFISNSEESIDKFEILTGYKRKDLHKAFSENIDEVLNHLYMRDEINRVLKNMLDNDDNLYNRCLEQVRKEFENSEEYNQLKKQKNEEFNLIVDEINEANKELNEAKLRVKEINDQYQYYQKECDLIHLKKEETEELIEKSLKDYRNNVVSVINEMLPLEFVKQQPTPTQGPKSSLGYSHTDYKINTETISTITDKMDVYDEFSEKLSKYYRSYYDCNLLASHVLSTVACRKSIIVDEYAGESVANCLSLVIDGKSAEKYSVFSVDADIRRLCHEISKSENRVIYLDGLLNMYNETALKHITKKIDSKILIFGIDEMNIFNLSKGIWKFANYIDVSNGFAYSNKGSGQSLIYGNGINQLRDDLNEISSTNKDIRIKKCNFLKETVKDQLKTLYKVETDLRSSVEPSVFYLNQIILNSTFGVEKTLEIMNELYENSLLEKCFIKEMDV